MEKSKYLNLASLYTKVDNDITTIEGKNNARDKLTILDLNSFNDLICIDKNGFEGCKNLINVILPLNIEKILDYAFNDCSIQYVNLSLLNELSIISKYAFANNKIKLLDLSNCKKLTKIYEGAFANNEIKKLKLPDSLKEINSYAFICNNLENVDLSNCKKLTKIGDGAFAINYINYEYDKERNAYIKILNTIKGIKFLKLPDSLEEIGLSTFEDNKIEDLDISNCINLKIINDSSFYKNKIKNLKLPNSIEKIGICSFTYNNIENLDLSNCNNLRNIALNAFLHNPLQEIKILENIKIVYDNNQLDDQWNKFVDFYNNNGKKAGDYKLINNQWQYFKFQ